MKTLVYFALCYVAGLWFIVNRVWNHEWSRALKLNSGGVHANVTNLTKRHVVPGIALIVPTRDRDDQWMVFKEYMCGFWESSEVQVHIWRIEQTPEMSFNRAWLFNVGLSLCQEDPLSCIAVHDVDLLPEPGVDYTSCPLPTLLSSEAEHFGWGAPYLHYAGGVVLASPEHWMQVNGMSNRFWGWGGEDDELYERFRGKGLLIDGDMPRRPAKGFGRFRKIREGHNVKPKIAEEYDKNVAILAEAQRNMLDPGSDGVSQTAFALEGQVETEHQECNPWVTVHTARVRVV
jgi:hypothetical protein